MVHSYHIIQLVAMADPLYPPTKAFLFVHLPVIKRVPPELACSTERIRRASCHRLGIAVFIKFKQMCVSPRIRTVKSYIYRDIAYDLNAGFVGIGLKLNPLLHEHELVKLIKLYLIGVLCAIFL